MKINFFLIRFAISILIIFGGVFTIRYFKVGELLLDQLFAALIGLVLLIASLIWRKMNQQKSEQL